VPTLELKTPEGIALRYEIAGAGSRFAAGACDALVVGLAYFIVLAGTALIVNVDPSGLSEVVWGILLGGLPLVLILYHFGFHALWRGQTPGKRVLGLRVTSSDGNPPSTSQNLLRSLLWPIDVFLPVPLPCFGLLGLVVITLSRRRQRLGDMVAGTLVLRDPAGPEESREPFVGQLWSELPEKTLSLDPGLAARFGDRDLALLRKLLTRHGLRLEERRKLFESAARFYAQRIGLSEVGNPATTIRELYLFLREARQGR
jgi:uncharacterized RDD family membrane protein YckC